MLTLNLCYLCSCLMGEMFLRFNKCCVWILGFLCWLFKSLCDVDGGRFQPAYMKVIGGGLCSLFSSGRLVADMLMMMMMMYGVVSIFESFYDANLFISYLRLQKDHTLRTSLYANKVFFFSGNRITTYK